MNIEIHLHCIGLLTRIFAETLFSDNGRLFRLELAGAAAFVLERVA